MSQTQSIGSKIPASETLSTFIDKLHFRTFNHVRDKVKVKYPNVSDEELKAIVNARLKDSFVKKKKVKRYYIRIFSTRPNCWFHDLMDNGLHSKTAVAGKDNSPRYRHHR